MEKDLNFKMAGSTLDWGEGFYTILRSHEIRSLSACQVFLQDAWPNIGSPTLYFRIFGHFSKRLGPMSDVKRLGVVLVNWCRELYEFLGKLCEP